MTLPWMKFQPEKWRGDEKLRAVSIAARGFWMECLCIMHTAKPYGHLLLNGERIDDAALARMAGVSVDEVVALTAELRKAGVLSLTGKGVIFSRRMTADHAAAQKGRKAANKRWSQNSETVDENDEPNGSPNGFPNAKREDSRKRNIPPKSPNRGAASPRGASAFFHAAERASDADQPSEIDLGSDRNDARRISNRAVGH